MATNMLNLTKVENQTLLTDVTRYNLSEQIRSAGDRSRRCKKGYGAASWRNLCQKRKQSDNVYRFCMT